MERVPARRGADHGHDRQGPGGRRVQREVTDTITRALAVPIADLSVGKSDGVVRVLVHVWHSVNLGWVNGWKSVGDIGDELEEAARLLLDDG